MLGDLIANLDRPDVTAAVLATPRSTSPTRCMATSMSCRHPPAFNLNLRVSEITESEGFQEASVGREHELVNRSSEPFRLCGHPAWQACAQAPSASLMMVLIVRAQRPHSALQPRQS
jgi:hypothetical protein